MIFDNSKSSFTQADIDEMYSTKLIDKANKNKNKKIPMVEISIRNKISNNRWLGYYDKKKESVIIIKKISGQHDDPGNITAQSIEMYSSQPIERLYQTEKCISKNQKCQPINKLENNSNKKY